MIIWKKLISYWLDMPYYEPVSDGRYCGNLGVGTMSKAESGATDSPQIGEQTAQNDEIQTLSRDEMFEMLSNRRRRHVLHYLQNSEQQATLSDLAEQIAAWENNTEVKDISASERKTVYTSLQQFHLPKMNKTGAVEYDQRTGEVDITNAAKELDVYLEVVDRYDIPWSFYYIGLSGIGTILVTLSWLGVTPFAAIPDIGWTVFLLATLLVSAVSHYILTRRMRVGAGDTPPEVEDA